MRIAVLAALAALTLAGTAAAAPACPQNRTLADYIGFGADGCLLGDKLFSNFQLTLGPNANPVTTPTANQITVSPINEPLNPGFTFTGDPPFQSPPGAQPFFFSYRLAFTVTVQPGGGRIHDASVEFSDPSTSGNANATANELICLGGLFESKGICADGSAPASLDLRDNTNQPDQTFDHATFAPTYDRVDTQTLIVMQQGTPDQPGSAMVQSITEQFSEVPEPAPLLLLAAVGLLVRRR